MMLNSKALLLGCAAALVLTGLGAQELGWAWVQSAGGYSDEAGNAIATDSQGNRYVTGYYYSYTMSFGAINLISGGGCDAFVAKISPEGDWLWAKRAWSVGYVNGFGIAVDSFDNVYFTGSFQGTAFFGPFSLTSSGWSDIFVAKLNTNGSWIWAVRAGGTLEEMGLAVALDGDANIYLTGFFQGTAWFGSTQLSSMGNSPDIFVSKLDGDGNWLWAVRAGGPETDNGNAIAVDATGNIFLTGFFKANAGFGVTTLSSSGYQDVFVAALGPGGNWLWAKRAGGPNAGSGYDDNSFGLVLDGSANIFLTGCFLGTADFGPFTLVCGTQCPDLFVARLDHLGNWVWAIQTGGANLIISSGIELSATDEIYLTGQFSQTASFDSITLSGSGGSDIFVASLDLNANWLWARRAGGDGDDRGLGLVCDSFGNICLTGGFSSTADFGPYNVDSVGVKDVFVAKLAPGVDIAEELAPGIEAGSVLHGAWPNPARRAELVWIKATLGERESGSLSIFNPRGQMIHIYPLQSGINQLSLETINLNSGVYLYQLKTGTTRITKKLAILQ